MKKTGWIIVGIVIILILIIGFFILNKNSSKNEGNCAKEGENIYDMAEKGPISCCSSLILEPCVGICTPSILGKCVKA